MKKPKRGPRPGKARRETGDSPLYTLEVCIRSGPISEEFARKNKVVSRTIQIRGNQTLEDLHKCIFKAFDRYEEHLYEFQVGGKGPMDPRARRYEVPMEMAGPFAGPVESETDVTRTTIGSLGLEVNSAIAYWFDFGDDWWHQINVVAIEEKAPSGKFPRVTKRVGESPPQYPNWEKEA